METKKTSMKPVKRNGIIDFLKEKKAKEGKLSKIGEWLLSGKAEELGWKVSQKNMKYILK